MAGVGVTRSGVYPGQTIRLEILFLDQGNTAVDPSSLPTIQISSPGALPAAPTIIVVPTTSTGVTRLDTGLYAYDYVVSSTPILGVWRDFWTATFNGATVTTTLSFIINTLESPVTAIANNAIDSTLSTGAETNVISLLTLLKARLGSTGKRRKRDAYGKYLVDGSGNFILEDVSIFTTDELYLFLKASLAEFNSIPHFTNFTFDDAQFTKNFQHELTEGAYILALAKQGILEKGREFNINDDGVTYQPPVIADYIKGYLSDFMTKYQERLKFIKCSMKPSPRGIGSVFSFAAGGASPAYTRLRHLRARQII